MRIFLYFLIGLIFVFPASAQEDSSLLEIQTLSSINSENAGQLEELIYGSLDTKHISMSPDGSMISIATQHGDADYDIMIFDVESGEEVSSMRGRMDSFRQLIWSPDSERIAVISGRITGGGIEERSVKVYTVALGVGTYYVGQSDLWHSDYIDLTDSTGYPVELVWSPASDMIAVTFYERLVLYDVEPDIELLSIYVPSIQAVDWSVDGRLIITQSADNVIRVWGVPPHNG